MFLVRAFVSTHLCYLSKLIELILVLKFNLKEFIFILSYDFQNKSEYIFDSKQVLL